MAYQYRTKSIVLPVTGEEAVIREPDANAEELLFENDGDFGTGLCRYLAYCTKRLGMQDTVEAGDIEALPQPDGEFLTVEVLRLALDNDTMTLRTGSDDGEQVLHDFRLADLTFTPLPEGVLGPDPTFELTVPRTGAQLVWGFPRFGAAIRVTNRAPKALDQLAIRSVGEEKSVFLARKAVAELPTPDLRRFREDRLQRRIGYDTRVELTLPGGRKQIVDIKQDPAFLFPGVPDPDRRSP